MKKQFIVNGKVTYPQQEKPITVFYFLQPESGEQFSIQTQNEDEVNAFNYGDTVNVTIEKKE